MRARNPFVAGLVIAVAFACSNPTPESAGDLDPYLSSEVELALFGASAGGEAAAVISEVELTRPAAELPAAAPAPRAMPVATSVPARVVGVDVESVAESAAAPMIAAPLDEIVLATGDVEASETPDEADHGGEHAPAAEVFRPAIIIRGGVTSRDPCAIHQPGSVTDLIGNVGAMINDRTPPGIGIDRHGMPNRTRTQGGSRGGFFPGGIR